LWQARQPCPQVRPSVARPPWLSPQPGSAKTALPRGLRGLVGARRMSRQPQSPTPPPRSTLQPGPLVPSAAPRPAPIAPSSPFRLWRCLPQPGRPDLGTRLAQLAVSTPASHCQCSGPPRGCQGCRTGPGTSRARSSIGRGGRTSPKLGPLTPVTGGQGTRENKVRRHTNMEGTGEKTPNSMKTRTLKIRHEGPP
jgi:hypothetical protein